MWLLEVGRRDWRADPKRAAFCRILDDIGIPSAAAQCRRLFVVSAPQTPELEAAVVALCADPLLTERCSRPVDGRWVIDVLPRPGVTDAEGDSLAAALAADGFAGVRTRTGMRYLLPPHADAASAERAARRLAHPVVEHASVHSADRPPAPERWSAEFMPEAAPVGTVEVVPIRGLDDDGLRALSDSRLLALPLADMRAVQTHFAALARDPTDVELETIAQTWSEHCAHRTFRATIHHRDPDGERTIDGLLKTFIVAATDRVNRPWVRSAFKDNAGVIAFDTDRDVSFKVETHNHPSAIEPFGGANTGVGGVVRDVLGVSAEPIANTDVLCFGPLGESAPPGALPSADVFAGVIAGIADYGNKMGIPTVNGAVLFDPGYAANPLVFCGTVGLAPRGAHPDQPQPGDLVIVAGGRTGRDGIHGATFSSEVLDADASADLGSVVQIGDPIVEKRLADALPRARDLGLYSAITDCGAGGFSSAVGEMAAKLGADIELTNAPLKYAGLRPWEIWLSEAQERMILAVPPGNWPALQDVFAAEGVEAAVLGTFTGDGVLRIRHRGRVAAELDGVFLHEGMPRRELESRWEPPSGVAPVCTAGLTGDLTPWLKRALADPNVASKEPIVRQYDHEVQGRTIGKPLVGPRDIGPADAAVVQPVPRSRRGLAIGCGINPRYGALDPYAMALLAVDEALRNVVAVGADPARTAILDNFCWGNPNLPDRLGGLVRAAQGCHDAAVGLRLPFISGKDSLFNEYLTEDGAIHAIPGTLLISALGIVPDVARMASSASQAPGNLLYLVG
ncbi:MAG: phosphoribosylformylglycinamidine synthase subunit PurL, partial [Thermomicrobiales bacterium]|nr:phosphoribosylformylglycinamidine synthase subunit PurL [Thermomicrobiales bacterium]